MNQSIIDKFFKNIIKTKRDDDIEHCWIWHGKHTKENYGIFDTPISRYAHQFSYKIFHGKIPEKLEIDHLCENRSCVNPNHLELVTKSENMRRIHSRNNTIQILYNLTNTEHDIIMDISPIIPKTIQCANMLENAYFNVGLIKFPNYDTTKLSKITVVDMLSIMLLDFKNIFNNQIADETYIHGYKQKHYYYFIRDILEFDKNVKFEDIFEYYKPDLIKNKLDKFNSTLDDKIFNFVNHLKCLGVSSISWLEEEIKYTEKELEKLKKTLDEKLKENRGQE
jgi:hypothetical protein